MNLDRWVKKNQPSTSPPCMWTAAACFITYCLFLSRDLPAPAPKPTNTRMKTCFKKLKSCVQRSDASFPRPSSSPRGRCGVPLGACVWRGRADKIRGERQKWCPESEVRKKTRSSHSWGVSEYQRMMRRAPPSGGVQLYSQFTMIPVSWSKCFLFELLHLLPSFWNIQFNIWSFMQLKT